MQRPLNCSTQNGRHLTERVCLVPRDVASAKRRAENRSQEEAIACEVVVDLDNSQLNFVPACARGTIDSSLLLWPHYAHQRQEVPSLYHAIPLPQRKASAFAPTWIRGSPTRSSQLCPHRPRAAWTLLPCSRLTTSRVRAVGLDLAASVAFAIFACRSDASRDCSRSHTNTDARRRRRLRLLAARLL